MLGFATSPHLLPQPVFDLHGRFCVSFLPCPLTNFFASLRPFKLNESGMKFVSRSFSQTSKAPRSLNAHIPRTYRSDLVGRSWRVAGTQGVGNRSRQPLPAFFHPL